MTSTILKVHSTIDIITNSSTEIYVEASQSTIKGVKDLINALFSSVGSDQIANDVFEFKLVGDRDEDDSYKDDSYKDVSLKVTVKDAVKDNNSLIIAAKILSDLTGLFSIDSQYDG